MKTICIDARLWGTQNTGIGVYIENLVANLPKDSDIKVVLIVDKTGLVEPKLAGFEKVLAKYHPYSNLAQFEMLFLLWKIKPDLLHVPHFTIPVLWSGKMVVTIHDLIKHLSRGADTTTRNPIIYWIKYFQYLLIMWLTVKRSAKIIVPTKYWQEILISNYGLKSGKVIVTYEGVGAEFSKKSTTAIDLPDYKPYALYVGNMYPHKNISTLLRAVKILDGKVLLILVCARSVFTSRIEGMIKKLEVEKWVKFLGSVSQSELVALYQHASVFVLPSLIEGFGLTGLEAMAAGVPVVAANASCLPEVYGNAARYFEAKDEKDLSAQILSVVENSEIRKSLIAQGKKQVKKYSWAKMARQTWQIYLDVLH